MGNDKERHERVIHTRVPESLETELKERASELGVSVSNLVRNVLQHALGLVNDIVADSEQIVRSARDGIDAGVRAARGHAARDVADDPAAAPPPAAAAPPVVLGWQQLVLERNAVCGRCNEILPRGSDAAVAVVDGGTGPRPVICIPCVEELRHAPQRTERPDRGPDRAS